MTASSKCKFFVDNLRKQVFKTACKAPFSDYYRGLFEGYAEVYNEVCCAYNTGASLEDMRADLEIWARATISSYDAFEDTTDYMQGIRDVAGMFIVE